MNNYKLKDCIELIIDYRGKTPKKLGGEWIDNGIRVISALNVHNGFIDNEDQIRCVSEDIYKKWMQIEIQRNDCLLASEGASLGENTIWDSDEKIVLGQRLYAIRTNPNILDPWFLAMYMQTNKFREQIKQISTGSTVFGISQPILLSLSLLLPDIDIQRRIGRLYKTIHNKIQLNNKINVELESMVQTLYDYWFLQFEFPNEEGKPYKSSGGKMVWNEELKREIPEGWKVKHLYDNDLVVGGTPNRNNAEYWNGNIPWLTTSEINNGVINSSKECITTKGLNDSPAKLIDSDSIIIAMYGLGTAGRVGYLTYPSATNQACCALTCENKNEQAYLYFYLINQQKYINSIVTGSIQKNLNKDTIGNFAYVYPDTNIYEKSKFKLIIDKMVNLNKQNQHLSQLRDFLLPLLMNGQVGFKE